MPQSPAQTPTPHEPASASERTNHEPRTLPFAQLERSFSRLFRAYTGDFDALAAFYPGDPWSADARADAAQRAAAAPYREGRDAIADVLAEQNAAFSTRGPLSDATRAHLDALRDPEGVAVVTGQQVGLFGGPLYTIYKTLTTLQLAKRLREETGRPVAPVFWLAGEDHNFTEIAHASLLRHNDPAGVHLPEPRFAGRNPGPVGRLAFEDGLAETLDALDDTLPGSDFKPPLMEAVRAAYAPGTPLGLAFARFLRALLPEEAGLVFIDPDDARLKAQVAPLFRQEIEAPRATEECVAEAGEHLQALGYHAQISARPANFFLLDEKGRLPLDLAADGRFSVRGTPRAPHAKELLERLDATPAAFSPNVALRPLVQDRLLPTAAYVAGPAEVAYHGQLGGVYERFGIEQPLLYPRASATLVEGKVQKVLDKFDLALPDFEEDLEPLFQRVARRDMDVDLDALFGDVQPPIHRALNDLKPQMEAVDRTLGPSVEAARAEIADVLDELKSKAMRAEKRAQNQKRAQLAKAQANLFPEGAPQERVVNVLYFLDKYGGAPLLADLLGDLSLDTRAHQVVQL
jgi:bacillithiol biosynthesis cysteine-adding enzyme BshC